MPLRIFGFFLIASMALVWWPAKGAVAETTEVAAVLAPVTASAYGPDDDGIVHLKDLDTFAFKMHREVTGAAGQRIYGNFKNGFSELPGFIPARFPASGKFAFDWEGEVELPDRFLQTLYIGSNQWTEWGVAGKFKGKYNDDALINLNERRNEVLFWWDSITGWLDYYGDALQCGTSTRIINDEQAVRCLAPNLSTNGKISLLNVTGIFTDDDTQTVSALTFEMWLTKGDNIPVRFDVAGTATDVKGNVFSGRFLLDIFDIDSDDIYIDLPR